MRCTATTKTGDPCKANALYEEDKCIFHSQSARARGLRSKRKPLAKEDMIKELREQLKKVKKSEADALEISKEVRMLLVQIMELQGAPVGLERGEGEEKQVRQKPWEERVREAEREIDDKESSDEIQ